MTALDLGTADRTIVVPGSAFSTLAFGDVTLVPGTDPHPVDTSPIGLPAIPRGTGDSATTLTSDDDWAPGDDLHVMFMAFEDLSEVTYFPPISGPMQAVLSADSIAMIEIAGVTFGFGTSMAEFTTGVTVLAFASTSTGVFLLSSQHGVLAASTAGTAPSAATMYLPEEGDGSPRLLGAWYWEGTDYDETTIADTAAAIVSLLVGEVYNEIEAVGYAPTYGTAAPETADEFDDDDPEAPALEPGGEQEQPDDPTFTVPSDVPDPVIRCIWQEYDAPSLNGAGFPVDWTPEDSDGQPYGRIQIVANGTDITWINDVPTPMPAWSRTEPFGSYSATIRLPQLSIFEAPPSWSKKGANVSIVLHKIAGGTVKLFTGAIVKVGRREDNRDFTLTCHGVCFLDDLQLRTPSFKTAPRDIGGAIAEAMNSSVSRRHSKVAAVATGCLTSVLGAWEPRLSGFVQNLLATAITNGKQWTVRCVDKSPVIVQKDTTTVHWEIRAGQPGIDIDLEDDAQEAPNRIFGQGVRKDGGHWRNSKYPNAHPDDTPPYPFDNPATWIVVGTTDSDTDTGDGVSVWQRKMGRKVTGRFSTGDRAALKNMQKEAGITVDGILGPQSWASTFNTGANTGTLDGAFIAPLASSKEVRPRLYGPDGDDLGPNPDYDPNVIVVDRNINFGQGVTRSEGRTAAAAILARDSGPGWQGTIGFTLDPPGGSKYEILEGQNIRVLGWQGENVLLHIASVDVNSEDLEYPVQITVDSKARDYPTLDAIRGRERDAVDPARVAFKALTTSKVQSDAIVYDSESPAGRVPKHPITANLWDVRQIPMGAWGDIVKMSFRTTSPARPFALALFGKKITAAQLNAIVGNVMTTSATESPWEEHGDELDDYAFINAWGWKQQPQGYYPRSYANPLGETTAPVTGRLYDTLGMTYATDNPPWLYVATISTGACYIEGRIYGELVLD